MREQAWVGHGPGQGWGPDGRHGLNCARRVLAPWGAAVVSTARLALSATFIDPIPPHIALTPPSGFPYPVALTLWHMVFCSFLATVIVKLGYVEPIGMSRETYLRAIVPIGFLYAGTLWLGNAAYLYLSVSFIQMLKALMPVAVFGVGCIFGTEAYSPATLANMLVVSLGVAIASWGEINFVLVGVALQMLSIATESTRLTLVQILLQRRGLKLNPITTLYYLAPACAAFLLVPFALIEAPKMLADAELVIAPAIMISNAAAAFGECRLQEGFG